MQSGDGTEAGSAVPASDSGRSNLELSSSGIPGSAHNSPCEAGDQGQALLKKKKPIKLETVEKTTSNCCLEQGLNHKLHSWGGRGYRHVSPPDPRCASHYFRDRIWNSVDIKEAVAAKNQYKTWLWNGKPSGNDNTMNQKPALPHKQLSAKLSATLVSSARDWWLWWVRQKIQSASNYM